MIWQNYPHHDALRVGPIYLGPITRPPGLYINPCAYTRSRLPHLDFEPALDECERRLARLFLRRYVTWCARRKRYAAMEGARQLWRSVRQRPAEPAPTTDALACRRTIGAGLLD